MEYERTVGTTGILFRDYLSFILFVASVASLITIYGIPLLLLWIPLLLRRVRLIRNTLLDGVRVKGMVASVRYMRGEWKLWYVYQVEDKTYKTRNYVLGFRKPVEEKAVVEVACDMEDPSKAFIVPVYMKEHE